MRGYLHLATFPEGEDALARPRGIELAILSNGARRCCGTSSRTPASPARSPTCLASTRSGSTNPSPRVYQLAVDRLGVPATAIGFVSSNGWDAAGAKAFGFRTFWVNRGGAPFDPLGVAPDHVIGSLADLPGLVSRPA